MSETSGILFTAFEPSGDDHAAPVIAQLRAQRPELTIWAMGGPKMQAAGAQLIENTVEQAAMLHNAVAMARMHLQRVARLKQWLSEHDADVRLHVPVDSPAANWSICKLVRKNYPAAKIVHLVAPQLWAWAPWRIRKMRRLSDHVLCLLPFEPDWFNARGMPATFVGHPIFDRMHQQQAALDTSALPQSQIKLAVLPGSRKQEIANNWPSMARAVVHLLDARPELSAVIAVRDEQAHAWLKQHTPEGSGAANHPQLSVQVGSTPAVLQWCDVALVVSGTATLQVAANVRPMVAMYRVNPITWHLLGRWLLTAPHITLPNLIAHHLKLEPVVPELIPHSGLAQPIEDALAPLLDDPAQRQRQKDVLAQLGVPFSGAGFDESAARALLLAIDGK